jgi:dUTP pyrophosphatase
MKTEIVLVNKEHKLPILKTPYSEGYDLKCLKEPKIVGEFVDMKDGKMLYKTVDYIEYDTEIKIAPQLGYYATIHPRSSISSKTWLSLANSVGVVDNDYRGNLLVRFRYNFQPSDLVYFNNGVCISINSDKIYKVGDDIVQLCFHESHSSGVLFIQKETLSETFRGNGGFGSTDKIPTSEVEEVEHEIKKFIAFEPHIDQDDQQLIGYKKDFEDAGLIVLPDYLKSNIVKNIEQKLMLSADMSESTYNHLNDLKKQLGIINDVEMDRETFASLDTKSQNDYILDFVKTQKVENEKIKDCLNEIQRNLE